MKFKSTIKLMAMGALLSLPFFQSCSEKDSYDPSLLVPNAIVTVKPIDSKTFYLQLNDKTKLWPVENNSLPYGEKEMRAFVNYNEVEMPSDVDKDVYAAAVEINYMDTILTKKPVQTEGLEKDIAKYGKDPVNIYKSWMTNVEDGFLTIHFNTLWGTENIKHSVNLILGTNPEDPYEVVFRHNAFNDYTYVQGDGIVAFSLEDLPDTNGETVKLKVKFDSFDSSQATRTAEFDYCTRKE